MFAAWPVLKHIYRMTFSLRTCLTSDRAPLKAHLFTLARVGRNAKLWFYPARFALTYDNVNRHNFHLFLFYFGCFFVYVILNMAFYLSRCLSLDTQTLICFNYVVVTSFFFSFMHTAFFTNKLLAYILFSVLLIKCLKFLSW